jgi:type VII secretion-associated serine protease mycosin
MLTRVAAVAGAGVMLVLPAAGAHAATAQSVPQEARGLDMTQLGQVGAPAAWRVSKGAGVTVGVLDTGADGTVPDLTGAVTSGPDYTAGADPAGYQPPHLHGTYIASLIAGHGSGPGDSEGMLGVAPEARILSVRVILDDGEPGLSVFESSPRFEDSVAKGIDYAVNHGVRVINMSLGSPEPIRSVRAAIGYAVSHGVVVVASAGNSGTSGGGYTPYDFPAAFTGVIAVAAVNSSGDRASFSDKNASVVVSAPGVSVVGAGPGGEYIQADGTSPAAAFVSGVVALIRSRYPDLTPALVEQALVTTTTHHPAGGYSPSVGFGEVDASAALAAAAKLASASATTGMSASARVGAASLGPIQVTHRDEAIVRGYGAAAALTGLGFLVAVVLLIVWLTRAARDRRKTAKTPLQELAETEQVFHAGLDLHLAAQPHARDVHRRFGQRQHVLAGGGDPDVGGRVIRGLLPHILLAVGSQASTERHAQVGNGATHGPVAEIVGAIGLAELREPAGQFLQSLPALLGGDSHSCLVPWWTVPFSRTVTLPGGQSDPWTANQAIRASITRWRRLPACRPRRWTSTRLSSKLCMTGSARSSANWVSPAGDNSGDDTVQARYRAGPQGHG